MSVEHTSPRRRRRHAPGKPHTAPQFFHGGIGDFFGGVFGGVLGAIDDAIDAALGPVVDWLFNKLGLGTLAFFLLGIGIGAILATIL
jgi:hypothetical protein